MAKQQTIWLVASYFSTAVNIAYGWDIPQNLPVKSTRMHIIRSFCIRTCSTLASLLAR